MYLKIRRILKDIFLRLQNRFGGLVKYLLDYKIVLISILYIIQNSVLISILRKIEIHIAIGLAGVLIVICTIIIVFIIRKKRREEIISKRKRNGSPLYWACTIFELFIYIVLTTIFAYLRVHASISHERIMEAKVTSFTSGSTVVNGFLSDEPVEKHSNQQLTVKPLQDMHHGVITISPNDTFILIKTSSFIKFEIGQVCEFRGTLEIPENFDEFDYRGYLVDKKIFLLMNNPIVECIDTNLRREGSIVQNSLVDYKNDLIKVIDQALNEPQSSLLSGIIFGQKRLFSDEFDEGTRLAGLSHIIAASGYNVTILILATERILILLPKKLRLLISLIVIWMFAILSGLSSSIIRACIMGSISLLAVIFGRSNAVHIAIPLASLIFVIAKPLIVFDIGFLLSISAVLGLTYIHPILVEIKGKITKKAKFVDENILPTLSCTLSTLPVSILTFGTFSIWSVPSNTIILPIIETTMFLGVVAIVFWNIFRPLSLIVFTTVNMQLKYFELVVNAIYSLGWGQFEFPDLISKRVSLFFLFLMMVSIIYFYPLKNGKYNYYLKSAS